MLKTGWPNSRQKYCWMNMKSLLSTAVDPLLQFT